MPLALVSLVASLLAAAPGLAPLTAAVSERAQARGLTEDSTRPLLEAIARVGEAGLPAEAVADKVLEGLAKGVDPSRIVRAADELGQRLQVADKALLNARAALPQEERRAALERLALVVQSCGSDPVLALADKARGAPALSLMAAAKQLVELRARGVEPAQAVDALGVAARHLPPGQLERLAALLDEYRAEGGRDAHALLDEVKGRAERGQSLDDLVDPFGDRHDPLNRTAGKEHGRGKGLHDGRPGASNAKGQPSLEKSDRAGSVPGFDLESDGRRSKDCANKKGRYCR